MSRSRWLAAVLLSGTVAAQAAVIDSTYTPLVGGQWSVDFNVLNDGSPAQIGEFTVYFAVGQFSGLSLGSSPATWSPLVIQPDPGIPADGFFDGAVVGPVNALTLGQSQGGFIVNFTYLGQAQPGSLPFDIVDANFNTVFSGYTTVLASNVPEPASLCLWLAAFALISVRRQINAFHCVSPATEEVRQ